MFIWNICARYALQKEYPQKFHEVPALTVLCKEIPYVMVKKFQVTKWMKSKHENLCPFRLGMVCTLSRHITARITGAGVCRSLTQLMNLHDLECGVSGVQQVCVQSGGSCISKRQ